jgi:hypothetical protein
VRHISLLRCRAAPSLRPERRSNPRLKSETWGTQSPLLCKTRGRASAIAYSKRMLEYAACSSLYFPSGPGGSTRKVSDGSGFKGNFLVDLSKSSYDLLLSHLSIVL